MTTTNGNGTAVQDPPVERGLIAESLRDAATLLRRPFTPEALRFKVQADWGDGGLIVAYIDARLVVDRLNLVVPHLWTAAYVPLGAADLAAASLAMCHLTIGDVTRRDVGQGRGKALISDALKRAAVHFGIGVSVYRAPSLTLDVRSGALRMRNTNKGPKPELTPRGLSMAADSYRLWLEQHGAKVFGEPLDHGDIGGAQGDSDEETGDGELAAPASDIPTDMNPVGDAPARDQPPAPPRREPPAPGKATPGQAHLIRVRARAAGLDDEQLAERIRAAGAKSGDPKDLKRIAAEELLHDLDQTEPVT